MFYILLHFVFDVIGFDHVAGNTDNINLKEINQHVRRDGMDRMEK